MNGKERVLAAIDGGRCDKVPVCPYLAGEYLEARANDLHITCEDSELARARAHVEVQGRYDVDWVQIFGLRRAPRGLPAVGESRTGVGDDVPPEELVEIISSDDLLAGGYLDALGYVVDKLGPSRFVAYGMPGPFASLFPILGFENMLVMLRENPGRIKALLERIVARAKEICRAARRVGADGIWMEEIFASADMISAGDYEEFAQPCEKAVIQATSDEGLKVLLYFCGDVMPRIERLTSLGASALAVEESKKTFVADVTAIRRAVGGEVCLFGNLDVTLLLKDDSAAVERELQRQIDKAGPRRFVFGTGSPVPPQVPPERVEALIETARRLGVE